MEEVKVEQPVAVNDPQVNDPQVKEPSQMAPVPLSKTSSKKPMIIIGVLLGFILFGTFGYFFGMRQTGLKNLTSDAADNIDNTNENAFPQPNSILDQPSSEDMTVLVKENGEDSTKSDIYLKDKNDKETFFITLTDIYRGHYHNAEYHNGNLYIIQRTGGDSGFQNNPNWTDSLWRYGPDKKGIKLFAVRGLDFRVSADERNIAITTNESFIVLRNDGSELKSFAASEVTVDPENSPMFRFLSWGDNSIWLDNTLGPSLTGAAQVDLVSFAVTTYDISELLAGPEYSFNPKRGLIAFSNYPAIFDADGMEDYEKSGSKVNLIVYDLKAKSQQQVATSVSKKFNPSWIDENTLEYDDPSGEGRSTSRI